MKIPHLIKNKKGFTLIELIFEIFVISILIIPTVILLGQLSLNIVQTEANSTASALSVQKSEELMWLYNYTTIGSSSGVFASPYSNYSYTVGVQCVNLFDPNVSGSPCDFKKVNVSVSSSNALSITTSFLFPQ